MMLEYAIEREETKILNHALSEQKAVERIACVGFRFDDRKNMPFIDHEKPEAHALQEIRNISKGGAKGKLAQPYLDGHLPKVGHARM